MRRVLFIAMLALVCANASAQDAKTIEQPIVEKMSLDVLLDSAEISKIVKQFELEKKFNEALKKMEFERTLKENEEILKEYPNLKLQDVILLNVLIELRKRIL